MSLAPTNYRLMSHTLLRPKGPLQLNTENSTKKIARKIIDLGFKKKATDIQNIINDEWTKIKGPQNQQFKGSVKLKFIIDIYTKLNIDPPKTIADLKPSKITIKKVSKVIGDDLAERQSGLKSNQEIDKKNSIYSQFSNIEYRAIRELLNELTNLEETQCQDYVSKVIPEEVISQNSHDVLKEISLVHGINSNSFTVADCRDKYSLLIEALSDVIESSHKYDSIDTAKNNKILVRARKQNSNRYKESSYAPSQFIIDRLRSPVKSPLVSRFISPRQTLSPFKKPLTALIRATLSPKVRSPKKGVRKNLISDFNAHDINILESYIKNYKENKTGDQSCSFN
jgi:hypothetical protein